MNLPPPGRPNGAGPACEPRSAPSAQRGSGTTTCILGADVGGTKTLLGLADAAGSIVDRRYANADFPDFSAVLAAFLAETGVDRRTIGSACLALAGPIADDGRSARLTNLPWSVDAGDIARRFAVPAPKLVNDFAAAAMGAVTAPPAELVTLQRGEPRADAPRLVVGAGTGLGMAIVLPEDRGWRIVPGEGGHAGFAPADAEQAALREFLAARHGRVTWERVVSGPGIAEIHEHHCGGILATAEIVARSLVADGAERRSVNLFLAAYGAFAGDMALACLARGGVFVAGGIAARLLPAIANSRFLESFNDKAEHAALAARMPVHVTADDRLGLRGALHLAAA